MISCLEYVNDRKKFLNEQVAKFKSQPCLAVIQVGTNSASNVYVRNKKKVCEEVGIRFIHVTLPENIPESILIEQIRTLNNKDDVHGIIVQLPLPEHINIQLVTNTISPKKDVDGFKVNSLFKPCTPKGIIDWMKYNHIDLVGKVVCVIGRSDIVGRPLVKLLDAEHATIIWCNSKTKDIRKYTKNADIIVSAIGRANYFDESYFSEGQIIVDVGINRNENNKLCGDIHEDVSNLVMYKTPVPNGVGKLTVCSLIDNVVEAYKLNGGV